ncbi:hypothetical protein R6Q59_009473 [Mikania micrantha]
MHDRLLQQYLLGGNYITCLESKKYSANACKFPWLCLPVDNFVHRTYGLNLCLTYGHFGFVKVEGLGLYDLEFGERIIMKILVCVSLIVCIVKRLLCRSLDLMYQINGLGFRVYHYHSYKALTSALGKGSARMCK